MILHLRSFLHIGPSLGQGAKGMRLICRMLKRGVSPDVGFPPEKNNQGHRLEVFSALFESIIEDGARRWRKGAVDGSTASSTVESGITPIRVRHKDFTEVNMIENVVSSKIERSPEERLISLYDNASRFALELREFLHTDDLRKRCKAFDTLQNLLLEIKKTAQSATGRLTESQAELHEKCIQKLIRARVYLEIESLNEVIRLLGELREHFSNGRCLC